MKRDLIFSIILSIIYFLVMGTIVYLKMITMSITTDTATLVNAICVVKKSVHLYYGLLLLKPLCSMLSCITFNLMLMMLGTLSITLTGVIVFLFAKHILKDSTTALLLQALFYANPMVHGLNLFGIHSEAFTIFFVALGVYLVFRNEDKPLLGYLVIMLGGLFKETAIFPLAGTFLWRLTNRKAKKWEVTLVVLALVGIAMLFLYFTKLPLRFIKGRYILSIPELLIDALYYATRKLVFLALLVLTVPIAFLSLPDLTLSLPDLLNLFGTATFKAYTKFVIGYQYQAIPVLMLIFTSVLVLRRLEVRRPRLVLASVLIIVALVDIWLSPVDVFYYIFGVHPIKFFVTYRFIVNDGCCLNAAYDLMRLAKDVIPRGSTVLAPDQLAPFLACSYKIKRAGLIVFHENVITAMLDPCTAAKYLAARFSKADYFINLPGLTQSIDIDPIYLKLICERIWWGNEGYVCKIRKHGLNLLKEIACKKEYGAYAYIFNSTGELVKKYLFKNIFVNWWYWHYMKEAILMELAPYLPPYSNVLSLKELTAYVPYFLGYIQRGPAGYRNFIAIFAAKLHIPVNGTYTFKVESDDGSVLLIDNKVVIDCWGMGTCNKEGVIRLGEGLHKLLLLYRNYGGAAMVKLYWKPPYACKEEPLPASYLYPLNVRPEGAVIDGSNVTTVGLVWNGNVTTLKARVCVNRSATIDVLGSAKVFVDGKESSKLVTGCHVVEAVGKNFEVRIRYGKLILPLIYPFSKATK